MRILILIAVLNFCCTPRPSSKLFEEIDGNRYAQNSTFKLSEPIIISDSSLFIKEALVDLEFQHPACEIYYTLDGSCPSKSMLKYTAPITIDKTCLLKAIVKHPEIQPSDIVEQEFRKVTPWDDIIKEIKISELPSPKYPGNGKESLIDLKKGTLDFHHSAWLGFEKPHLHISIELTQNIFVDKISISMLSAHTAWIFLPEKIDYCYENIKRTQIIDLPKEGLTSTISYIELSIEKEISALNIDLYGLNQIPDWHPGKGLSAWMFIDEIILN